MGICEHFNCVISVKIFDENIVKEECLKWHLDLQKLNSFAKNDKLLAAKSLTLQLANAYRIGITSVWDGIGYEILIRLQTEDTGKY